LRKGAGVAQQGVRQLVARRFAEHDLEHRGVYVPAVFLNRKNRTSAINYLHSDLSVRVFP
jgi:hypothetical protein